jgi:phage repressor protein C with HTH and peptisase S24 domain
MSETPEIVQQFREKIFSLFPGKNDTEIARALGVNYSALRTALGREKNRSSKNGPGLVLMHQIKKGLEKLGLDSSWILEGEQHPTVHFDEPDESEFYKVPLYGARAAAGDGMEVDYTAENVEAKLAFRRDWLHDIGVPRNMLKSMRVRGQSMAPNILDGDTVLYDATPDQNIANGRVYVLRVDNVLYIKRLYQRDHILIIESDSPNKSKHPVWTHDLKRDKNLEILGRVIWIGRDNLE